MTIFNHDVKKQYIFNEKIITHEEIAVGDFKDNLYIKYYYKIEGGDEEKIIITNSDGNRYAVINKINNKIVNNVLTRQELLEELNNNDKLKFAMEYMSQIEISNLIQYKMILQEKSRGLIMDAIILKDNLRNCEIYTTDSLLFKSNANIFVEQFPFYNNYDKNLEIMKSARVNLFLVNQDFFFTNAVDMKLYEHIDLFLCKTLSAVKLIVSLNKNWKTFYMKFGTSIPINLDLNINKKEELCLHLAGKSSLKNTYAVIETWLKHHDSLPPIYISCYDFCLKHINKLISGKRLEDYKIKLFVNPIPDNILFELKRKCLYYICPSAIEGYGHYINEGRIFKSIVITVDAEPMNELIDKTSEILIKYSKTNPKNNVVTYSINSDDLYNGIITAIKMSDIDKTKMRLNAHDKYVEDVKFFKSKLVELNEIIKTKLS